MICNNKTKPVHSKASFYTPHFGNFINDFFNTAIGEISEKGDRKRFTNPQTNVREFDDRYILDIALPGFDKTEIKIENENELLIIEGVEKTGNSVNYRLREFNYNGFKKTFRLPDTVDSSKIEASFHLGILQVILFKKEEAIPQPLKKITIS